MQQTFITTTSQPQEEHTVRREGTRLWCRRRQTQTQRDAASADADAARACVIRAVWCLSARHSRGELKQHKRAFDRPRGSALARIFLAHLCSFVSVEQQVKVLLHFTEDQLRENGPWSQTETPGDTETHCVCRARTHAHTHTHVKIIIFSFMPKIIMILRLCSMKIFRIFPSVNISKLNIWLLICIAKNFIWTTLKMIFSIFRFLCTLRFQIYKYCPNHISMEILFIQFYVKQLTLTTGFVLHKKKKKKVVLIFMLRAYSSWKSKISISKY